MPRSAPSTALLLVLALGVCPSCSDTEASERLRQNALATWESALEVALETRDEAEAELMERLAELEPYLDELRKRAESYGLQARGELERKISELEAEHLALREQLEALRSAGRETWERLAKEAQAELDRLKQHVSEAVGGNTD